MDDVGADLADDEAAHEAACSESGGTTSSDDGESSLNGNGPNGDRGERPGSIPTHRTGQYVQWELRTDDRHGNNYLSIRVACSNPAHGRCGQRTSVDRMQFADIGPRAAEGFLGAWLEAAFDPNITVTQHRRTWRPRKEQVKSWLEHPPGA